MTNTFQVSRDIFELAEKPYSRLEAWLWLIANARWRSNCEIKRGQLETHYRSLAATWGWHRSRVDRFLRRLQTETKIETNSETKSIRITLCNYDKYQFGRDETETNSETKIETLKKQDINRLKQKKESSTSNSHDFEIFWGAYPKPRNGGKEKARQQFENLVKAGEDPDGLVAAATRYADCQKVADGYIVHVFRWLRDKRFNDEPDKQQPKPVRWM